MTFLLALLVSFYLGVTGRRMDPRPEDRKEAEIVEGAGELGFFPPYSWWPLWCGLTLAVCVLGVVFGWWLFIIGVAVGIVTLSGFIFEYYRGEHAH
jgi:Cytochrome c oxidase subunit IV